MTSTPLATQVIYQQLATIVGGHHASLLGAVCTVSPADVEQAGAVLRFADRTGLSVCIKGSGSKLDWIDSGRTDLRLLTHRMNIVREHTWQDMTCTVEAGCSWNKVRAALAEHGQQIALDPLWPETATVGGVIAANDSGALRLRYGGLRDLVIGMTVVLADGTVAKSGGKVVKNVAGYDLPKLLCGSFGTLAMIAEVTFRLHSIAPSTTTVSVQANNTAALGKLMRGLMDSHLSTQSMQLRTEGHAFALDVRLAASPEVLATQQDGLIGMATGMGLSARISLEDVWAAREQLFSGGGLVLKATMIATEIASAIQAIQNLGGNAVAQSVGIMIARVPVATPIEEVAALRVWLEAAGGSLVVLQNASVAALDRWGTLPNSLPLMRAVKQQFDPHGVLNPGRFLGGI